MSGEAMRERVMTEADTCREFVTPKLVEAGWGCPTRHRRATHLHQRPHHRGGRQGAPRQAAPCRLPAVLPARLPAGRRRSQGSSVCRLRPVCSRPASTPRSSASSLPTPPTAIASSRSTTPPAPSARWIATPRPPNCWQRLTAAPICRRAAAPHLLEPFNLVSGKVPRYYQQIAIHRVIEAILLGQKRILATLATGTGKTCVAFQICWKLWNSRWNRTGEYRRPKILFLADRNILVDDPMAKMFAPFGDARHKIAGGDVSQSRDMYFGIYQALSTPAPTCSASTARLLRPDHHRRMPSRLQP
jgi:type I restriction enzyme R subunit